MYRGVSGNMKIFRGLCCGAQIFCGVCVAMNMTSVRAIQILLSIILGAFGAVSGWLIQDMAYRTHLRGKLPMLIGAVCIALWVVLGLLCGQVWIPLLSAIGEFLLGYFAAYGGKRSDLGSYAAAQVLGFRRYAKKLPTEDVSRLMANDPDYFFNLAPFTLALGSSSPSPEPSAIGSWSGAHIWSPAPGTSRRRRNGQASCWTRPTGWTKSSVRCRSTGGYRSACGGEESENPRVIDWVFAIQ